MVGQEGRIGKLHGNSKQLRAHPLFDKMATDGSAKTKAHKTEHHALATDLVLHLEDIFILYVKIRYNTIRFQSKAQKRR